MLNIFHYMSFYFLLLVTISPPFLTAQTKNYIAIIPTFHHRQEVPGTKSSIELNKLKFVIFVYENAVVVYSECDFLNKSENTIEQEFALPSKGHNSTGNNPEGRVSSGIRSTQLWVEGERVNPQIIKDGDEEWYTIHASLKPHESRKVKALFWAATSLADIDDHSVLDSTVITNGKRGFLIDIAHAEVWKNTIQSINITVLLKDGIFPSWDTFSAGPPIYNFKDSTLTWSMKFIRPSKDDNVLVRYESENNANTTTNTIEKLSTFIVKDVYDKLQYYVSQMEEL